MEKIKQSAMDIDQIEREHAHDVLLPKDIKKNLNIGRETLRYYEKLGLIHPHINEENGYRMFQQEDMYRLFFIDFLKKREFQASQIKQIIDDQPSSLQKVIYDKKLEIEQEIIRLQKIKQQLEEDERLMKMISKHLHEPEIVEFPLYASIYQMPSFASFDQYQAFINEMDEEATYICQLIREITFTMEEGYQSTCMHVVKRVEEAGNDQKLLMSGKCVYMLVKSKLDDSNVMERMFFLIKEWLIKHQLKAKGTLYIQPAFLAYEKTILITYCHCWIFVE